MQFFDNLLFHRKWRQAQAVYKTQFFFTDRFDVRSRVAPTQLQNFTDLNYMNSAVLRVVYLPLFVISAQNGKSQMQYEHLFSICLER